MLSAGIEISVQCPKCDGWVPLNGPLLRVHCDKCQTAFELGPRVWFRLLRDVYAELAFNIDDGQGYYAEAKERYDVKVLYGSQRPSCGACNEPLGLAEDALAAYEHECPACGAAAPVTPAPSWFADALAPPRLLVNAEVQEEEAETSEAGEAASETSAPVAFTCPQCGGSLLLDGRDRMITCSFCGVNVYLPDDLWFRLHPARTKARWFVVFGDVEAGRVTPQIQFLRRTSPYIVKMYERPEP